MREGPGSYPADVYGRGMTLHAAPCQGWWEKEPPERCCRLCGDGAGDRGVHNGNPPTDLERNLATSGRLKGIGTSSRLDAT